MSEPNLKNIVEAALHAARRPLSVDNIANLFAESERPERSVIRETIAELQEEYVDRGVELVEVASGWRVQVRTGLGEWISRLWQERPPRYSRALLETLSIVAYRQPVTRGEIEEIRGVSVSSTIMRTLLDRGWLRVVGHRDVPGKPALFATTREFLDYFGLKKLENLPPLADLKDLDSLNVELELGFEESGILPAAIVEPSEDETDQVETDQVEADQVEADQVEAGHLDSDGNRDDADAGMVYADVSVTGESHSTDTGHSALHADVEQAEFAADPATKTDASRGDTDRRHLNDARDNSAASVQTASDNARTGDVKSPAAEQVDQPESAHDDVVPVANKSVDG